MDPSVRQILSTKHDPIVEACRRHRVLKLDLFGSATGDAFDPARSDIDLVVTFLPEAVSKAFDHYFDLKECLEGIFGRPVDLVTSQSVRNPHLEREIRQTRQAIYAAPSAEAVE